MEEVARQANYEGNESLLLFQRLRNPVIQKQVIDLLEKAELGRPSMRRKLIKDEAGKIKRGPAEPYIHKTREEITQKFLKSLEEIETSTPINFEERGPDSSTMPAAWMPHGKLQDPKKMSAVEAHEKGHKVRRYGGLREYFAPGFNFDLITYTKADSDRAQLFDPLAVEAEADGKISGGLQAYMSSPNEIAERMAQLKNYFGFKGAEEFTANHLKYAREHYIEDTGLDTLMTQFFQAITPETEKEFLRLINSSGI